MGFVPENKIIQRTIDPGLPGTPTAQAPYLFAGHIPGYAGTVGEVVRCTTAEQVKLLGLSTVTEAAAAFLQAAGGPVFVQPLSGTQAGSITPDGSNPSTNVTITGDAKTHFGIVVEIVEGGNETTAKYVYSLDTFAAQYPDFNSPIVTASRVRTADSNPALIPDSGLQITFAVGSYTVGQRWRFEARPAATEGPAIAAGSAGILSSGFDVSVIVAPDQLPLAADVQSVAASLSGLCSNLATKNIFTRGICSGSYSEPALANAERAALTSSSFVAWTFGACLTFSPLPIEGYGYALAPVSNPIAVRSGVVTPDTDISRPATGALPGVLWSSYDNAKEEIFNGSRVASLRTYPRKPGFYPANVAYLSNIDSDFDLWPMGIVHDLGARIAADGMFKYLAESFNVNPNEIPSVGDVGTIAEFEARNIESDMNSLLKTGLLDPLRMNGAKGYCSAVRFEVDRHHNIVSTKKMLTRLFIRPVAYAKEITIVQSYTLENV